VSEQVEVLLDTTRCKSYGICVSILPDVFDTPAGSPTAVLLQRHVEPDDLEELEEAVRACPAQAIAVGSRTPSDPA
jgi:ferredoxin